VSSSFGYGSILAVGLGGALGANSRYLVGRQVTDRWPGAFPWGTLLVNVSGCVALGLLVGWLSVRGDQPAARLVVATGFLGAYTTFSAFAYEAVRLAEDGDIGAASFYAAASLVLCLAGASAGIRLGRRA
jgi:CrcB protein